MNIQSGHLFQFVLLDHFQTQLQAKKYFISVMQTFLFEDQL